MNCNELSLHLIEENPGDEERLPFHYFNIIRKEEIIGKISIRFGNNAHSYYNGHVGFEIYPKHRGNNYAFQAVTLILKIAKKHGMNEIYLTCKQSNTASRKIFEKLRATLVEIAKIPRNCFFYRDGIEDYAIYRLQL